MRYRILLSLGLLLFFSFSLSGCNSPKETTPSSSPSPKLSQNLIVDTDLEEGGPIFRLTTDDGRKRLEVWDRQWEDGTPIRESLYSERNIWGWKGLSGSSGPTSKAESVIGSGVENFHVYQLIDPRIVSLDVIYGEARERTSLTPIKVGPRRFVAFYLAVNPHEYYQVYGLDKDGKVLWQQTPDAYWEDNPITEEEMKREPLYLAAIRQAYQVANGGREFIAVKTDTLDGLSASAIYSLLADLENPVFWIYDYKEIEDDPLKIVKDELGPAYTNGGTVFSLQVKKYDGDTAVIKVISWFSREGGCTLNYEAKYNQNHWDLNLISSGIS